MFCFWGMWESLALTLYPSDEDILYFCDESSQIDDAFMGVAGLAVSRRMVGTIARELNELNLKSGYVGSEVKWSTLGKRKVCIHTLYVDYLFNLIANNMAHFHIRFAPFGEYDHSLSGERKRADTVSKMFYSLLLHRPVAFYGAKRAIYVYPDDGECTAYLPEMRNPLCAEGYWTLGAKPNCVKEIVPRSSKREPLLQLLDVTLGALTAVKNARQNGAAKTAVAAPVMNKNIVPDLTIGPAKHLRKFNVWNVTPKWKK